MTLDWSPLAIATVALACVAVWSILQTRATQRSERRQRLLNEVIEWVLDINSCEVPIATMAIAGIRDSQSDRAVMSSHLSELAFRCAQMTFRGRYIYTVTLESKLGQDLQRAITELVDDLEARIILLKHCDASLSSSAPMKEFDVWSAKARQHWLAKIRESAYKVIEEVIKIKIKDIG